MLRRYDEAIAQCREYVRLAPKFATTHLYLGLSDCHKGEYVEALQLFKDRLGNNPAKLYFTAEALRLSQSLRKGEAKLFFLFSAFSLRDLSASAVKWRS